MSKDVEGQASNEPVNSQADVGAMTPAELYTRRAKPAQADPPKEEPSAPQEQTAVEGHAEQQPDAQPETPKDDKKAKPKPEKREKPAEKADAPPEFRRIKLHNGAEVDVPAQYAEQVEDAVQTARQFIPLQRKHQEMLEALAAQQSRPPQTEQTPVAPEDAKKAFSEAMAPTVKRLVDGGFLSADTVEINPDVANVIALLVQRQAHAEAFQQQAMGFYNTAVVPLFQGAAEARQRGEKDEADQIKLAPAGDQRPGQRKDQHAGIIQNRNQRRQRHDAARDGLKGAMPARASSSARSFSGWPAWPLIHSQRTLWRACAASSRCHNSAFFTGLRSAVRQPLRFQPWIHWVTPFFT